MCAASTGDDRAFGILATKVQDDLFRFALAQGLRHADAAEACQETLLRAYRSRSTWRPDGFSRSRTKSAGAFSSPDRASTRYAMVVA